MNFKYSYAVSRGSSCFSRRFIDVCKMSNEYLFFDWIGSSMWAINELMASRFHGLDNINDYQPVIIRPSDQKKIITHAEFYLRFLHDFSPYMHARGLLPQDKKHAELIIEKYRRRAERFIDVLSSLKELLFIRIEEDVKDRIIYEKYAQKPKDELQELFRFTALVKDLNPKLEFQVLFFSTSFETRQYIDERIFVVGHQKKMDWKSCATELSSIVQENRAFLAPLLLE